jgi:hypothetical protein
MKAILLATLLSATPVQFQWDPDGTLRRMDEQAYRNRIQSQMTQDRMQRAREFEQQQMQWNWQQGQQMQQRLRDMNRR